MPELPEVETIKRQLNRRLKKLTISEVKVFSPKNFKGNPKDLIGKKILGVDRRAKISLIRLETGLCLAIHLKMTGQLIYSSKLSTASGLSREGEIKNLKLENSKPGRYDVAKLPNKYTRVIVKFTNKACLYFNDLRKFGWMRVIKNCDQLVDLARLGPEAIDEKAFSLNYFKNILGKSGRAVKLVIMDQEKLAGVGNIYANEALYLSGIRPDRPANKLNNKEIEKLREAIIKVLKEAIEHKGTSDKDEAYRQISGEKGEHQYYLSVYGRKGEKCRKCKGTVEKMKLGGRGSFYCPGCQK